jgi:16S rRNA (guanine527-N7)-methyltransferase
MADRLGELAARRGLDGSQADRLRRLLELLRDDGTAPTTVRDPAEAADVHLADSLVALDVAAVREARWIADLGAGAGFPGLPLAVALPDARVSLVESLGRKCAFLERAIDACAAGNAEVVCRRAEDWDARALDVVCVRAVAPLAVLVEYAAPLLRLGGTLLAWKGRPEDDEVRAGEEAAAIVGLAPAGVRRVDPFPGADHRALYLYSKVVETPDRFPRRAGMARKRPLAG